MVTHRPTTRVSFRHPSVGGRPKPPPRRDATAPPGEIFLNITSAQTVYWVALPETLNSPRPGEMFLNETLIASGYLALVLRLNTYLWP